MKRYSRKLQITALCLLGTSISVSAMAEEASAMSPDEGWAQMALGKSKNAKGDIILNEVLYTTDSSRNGTAFLCSGTKLRVLATSTPQDMSGFIDTYNESKRQMKRNLSLSINGNEVHDSKWLYKYKIGFVKSSDRKTSVKIYNAAIRGDNVQLNGSDIPTIALTLPSTNSNFATFGQSCGVGKNKQS